MNSYKNKHLLLNSLDSNVKFVELALRQRIKNSKETLKNNVVRYVGTIGGYKGAYDCFKFTVTACPWGIISYASLPFAIKEKKRVRVAELIARINSVVRFGHFDLNYQTGEVHFRISLLQMLLPKVTSANADKIAFLLVQRPVRMVYDWVDSIDAIVNKDKDVEEMFDVTIKRFLKG